MERLIEGLFIEDFKLNKKFTYISQVSIITIKSLLPNKDEEGVRIDYKRFEEELKLWRTYRLGDNISLLNFSDKEVYWKAKDDSIGSRMLALILSNKSFNIIEDELIKNILYTSGSIESLMEYLSISYIIHALISNKGEEIKEGLKDHIIRFSQVEFLEKYEKYYRFKISGFPNNFKVSFEREKINLLNILNGIESKKYMVLQDILKLLQAKEPTTFLGRIIKYYLKKEDREVDLPSFYKNMGDYLVNLNKTRINPDKLKINDYVLPDVFSFNTGDSFFHSLLRDCKVLNKEIDKDCVISLIQTKTGIYKFKKLGL